jgi:signal transduction histidine kinase
MHLEKDDVISDAKSARQISVLPSILEIVCKVTGLGFAAVARVTEDRWIACQVRDQIGFGLKPLDELKIETTICNEIRQSRQLVVIDHVSEDPVFNCHPTPVMFGFQSYISVPIIRKDNSFFGTLCALDPQPAKLKNSETINLFTLFADLISFHLTTLDELSQTTAELEKERRITQLREQFIAVLGHDLRNPVTSIHLGSELMQQTPLNEVATSSAKLIQRSSRRVLGLIENMLDFARGRLGEGIILRRARTDKLGETLHQVIDELQPLWPSRQVERDIHIGCTVDCDEERMSQLFSNLISNAFIHGRPDTQSPIVVRAKNIGKEVLITVTNEVADNFDADFPDLFKAFHRGGQYGHLPSDHKADPKGLGLGLFIAAEIAKAHDGLLSGEYKNGQVTFRFSFNPNASSGTAAQHSAQAPQYRNQ